MKSWKSTVVATALVVLALGAVGCATTGSTGGSSGGTDVITREEIANADVSNLFEVVKRLRPQWLRIRSRSMSRGTEIVVVRDGTVIGNTATLREIGRDGIESLRWMDGETAAATLVGARENYVAGAIVIERGGGS